MLAVLVFHLRPEWLPGGFYGVDVFFAISGFVVTRSMLGRRFGGLRELLAWFYARRLMRIMPALVAMLLVTILAAQLFIPEAWLSRSIAQTALSAFYGASNIVLATDSETYFGPQSAFNPFVHTWSLGVEEQFYLLFPFLFYWHHAKPRAQVLRLIAALSIASLGAAAALGALAPRLGFYLIVSRFWELGLGMLLCLTAPVWQPRLAALAAGRRRALALVSALLVAAVLPIAGARDVHFPLVLAPVLGTIGLIACVTARRDGIAARLLGAAPMVAIGKLSYSLYLWHLPVYALFRWTCGLDGAIEMLAATALAFALATASYLLVETPLRSSRRIAALPRGRVVRRALATIAAASLGGLTLVLLHDRISLSVTRDHAAWYAETPRPLDPARSHCSVTERVETIDGAKVTSWTPGGCTTPPAGFALYAIGDSHNLAYAPAYRQLAADLGVPVRAWFRTGCPFLPLNVAVQSHGRSCEEHEAKLVAGIAARAHAGDVIFLPGLRLIRITNQYDHDRDILGAPPAAVPAENFVHAYATIAALARGGARVVIEAPKPIFPSPPFRCADWFNAANPICRGGLSIARAEIEARRAPVIRAMRELAGGELALDVWDPLPVLCPGAVCEAMPGGRPLFFDGDHLSGLGNDRLYPKLRAAILAASRRPVVSAR